MFCYQRAFAADIATHFTTPACKPESTSTHHPFVKGGGSILDADILLSTTPRKPLLLTAKLFEGLADIPRWCMIH